MTGRVLGVCALLCVVACGDDQEPAPTGDIVYQVLHYDYAFDMETRAAHATLSLDIIDSGDCLTIPMRAEGLTDVTLDGAPITSGGLDAGLLTACGAGWQAGSQIELSASVVIPMTTWQDTQVGYSEWVDAEGNPFTYLVSWIGGCDRHGPCDNAANQFATYRFTVTHPDDTLVTCPGVITPTPTQTTCVFDFDGGPTYSTFGVAMSPSWSITDIGTWGSGVSVKLYDSPSTGATARFDAALHDQFFTWLESLFGPYPYGDELRFVFAPTYWGGFEHPGNIVLSDSLSVNGQRNTLHHEMVHMWAGNKTTLADTYDFAWKEAIANYLPLVFLEENVSATQALSIARSWRSQAQASQHHLVPEDRPELIDFWGDVYAPGPLILFRQLEALFDRDKILAALQDFLSDTRAASMEDLRASLETATGADLSGYFAAWVYGSGVPERPRFVVTTTDLGGGQVELKVDEVDSGTGTHGCAFYVRLLGASGESDDVWVDRGVDGMATTTQVVTPGFVVTDHIFDPGVTCVGLEQQAAAGMTPPRRINPFLAPVRPIRW